MGLMKRKQFTFSYGQCLYCFIGLVQIKTSVLRKEETGQRFSSEQIHSSWDKCKMVAGQQCCFRSKIESENKTKQKVNKLE